MDHTFTVDLGSGIFAIFDAADKELIEGYKWNYCRNCNRGCNADCERHFYAISGFTQKAHNIVLGFTPNNGLTVDHINKNTLDNRQVNLRIATKNQQNVNRNVQKNSTTQVAGVSFYRSQKWSSYVANWYEDGKRVKKSFSVSKYPNALELAIAARKNAEETVEVYASSFWNEKQLQQEIRDMGLAVPQTAVAMLALLKANEVDIDALRV
jgi:hypothetical protein